MGNNYEHYQRTNRSFEEVFSGEYNFDLTTHPKTVLDIGANEGAFTAWATQQWPEAQILAFEPIPENASIFLANHGLNPKITLCTAAVSEAETLEMHYGANDSGECSAFDLGEQKADSITVETISAKTIPSCEIVKIDTEGCEVDILDNLDLSKTEQICCEYHRDSDKILISAIAAKAGLSLVSEKLRCKDRGILRFARKSAVVTPKKHIKVLIGVPSYFAIDPHFHVSLLQAFGWMSQQNAIEVIARQFPDVIKLDPNEPLITGEVKHSFGDSPNVGRARNGITRHFLEGDYTDLLFIDSDLIFSVEQLKRILTHDEDVVGGIYFKKQEGNAEPVINSMVMPEIKANGLVQVAYMGTGFMRIKRHVLEKMIEVFGEEMWYDVDGAKTGTKEYNFWQLGLQKYPNGKRRWLSEDWYFCQKCADLGIKVWADRHIPLKHSGNAVYPLSYQQNKIFDGEQSPSVTAAATSPQGDAVAV